VCRGRRREEKRREEKRREGGREPLYPSLTAARAPSDVFVDVVDVVALVDVSCHGV